MKNMTLKDLAVDHDYYCSDNNYYSREASLSYNTFAEFYKDFHNADVDMNLIFRWDVRKLDESDEHYLELFMMKQRKGIFTPIFIEEFKEEDIPSFIEYLQPHVDKLKSIWKPFTFK